MRAIKESLGSESNQRILGGKEVGRAINESRRQSVGRTIKEPRRQDVAERSRESRQQAIGRALRT